jgi:hypothetical protein
MSTTRQITFTVPTEIDITQIYTHVAGPAGTMNATLNAAESNINSQINTTIATVDDTSEEITEEGEFVTEMKNYVDDRLADFEKHVTESLATKANLKTTDALDEFFKVVSSAMTFSGPNASYNPPA